MKQLRQKSLFLLILLFVLVLGNGCAHGSGVQDQSVQWKFAVISDTQGKVDHSCINKPVIRAIASDIAAERPDFVLVAGDLVNGWFRNGGTEYVAQYANWKESMRPVYDAGIRVYPVRGNHDVGPERVVLPPLPAHLEPPAGAAALQEQAFKDAFSQPYIPRNGPQGEQGFTFSFFHKNAFIVGLDVYGSRQHKVHQGWLNKEFELLKESRARDRDIQNVPVTGGDKARPDDTGMHVFVYAHEPAFEVRHRDCLAFYREERDVFWDALGSAGSRIYFCGHDHLYNRAVITDSAGNQIRQIVVGTGGGHLVKWSGTYKENARVKGEYNNSGYHGYVLVTIDGPRATVVWKALVMLEKETEWRVLDSFSYTLPHAAEAHGYGK